MVVPWRLLLALVEHRSELRANGIFEWEHEQWMIAVVHCVRRGKEVRETDCLHCNSTGVLECFFYLPSEYFDESSSLLWVKPRTSFLFEREEKRNT